MSVSNLSWEVALAPSTRFNAAPASLFLVFTGATPSGNRVKSRFVSRANFRKKHRVTTCVFNTVYRAILVVLASSDVTALVSMLMTSQLAGHYVQIFQSRYFKYKCFQYVDNEWKQGRPQEIY